MHDLLERLAELEHEQWMAWAKRIMETEPISEERRQRWQRYMVPYAELPEEVKEQDREWARKVLKVIEDYTEPTKEVVVEMTRKAKELGQLGAQLGWLGAALAAKGLESGSTLLVSENGIVRIINYCNIKGHEE
ncbi:MAG: RyR domain-containing protein [Moorellaceae bacterium]